MDLDINQKYKTIYTSFPWNRCPFYFIAEGLHPVTRMRNAHVFPALLDAVADRVSTEYLRLGIELGFSVDDIKRFRMNNRTNTLEIIREMLSAWMQKNKAECTDTVGWLATALLNARGDISSLFEWEEEINAKSRQSHFPLLYAKKIQRKREPQSLGTSKPARTDDQKYLSRVNRSKQGREQSYDDIASCPSRLESHSTEEISTYQDEETHSEAAATEHPKSKLSHKKKKNHKSNKCVLS